MSVAEDTERRLVITESACLDKFVVDTDRLSASGEKIRQMNVIRKCQMKRARSPEGLHTSMLQACS